MQPKQASGHAQGHLHVTLCYKPVLSEPCWKRNTQFTARCLLLSQSAWETQKSKEWVSYTGRTIGLKARPLPLREIGAGGEAGFAVDSIAIVKGCFIIKVLCLCWDEICQCGRCCKVQFAAKVNIHDPPKRRWTAFNHRRDDFICFYLYQRPVNSFLIDNWFQFPSLGASFSSCLNHS